jgi:mannosyltransferase OCH1-like enzyme
MKSNNFKYIFITIIVIVIIMIYFLYTIIKRILYLEYLDNIDYNKYDKNDILLPQYKYIIKNDKNIPKKIFQTYKSKKNIPKIVFDNIDKYAKSYEYNFYNDEDCEAFLKKYFIPDVFKKFKSMKKGAHKADLFRYCLLYVYGGIYLDIKTELIKSIDEIFNKNCNFYTVISKNPKSIYQGILATYPFNDIFKRSINFILESENSKINDNYTLFIDFLYRDLEKNTINKELKQGSNIFKNNDQVYLFKEKCCSYDCINKTKDRYGLYCIINDKDKYGKDDFIIKTRYESFPW